MFVRRRDADPGPSYGPVSGWGGFGAYPGALFRIEIEFMQGYRVTRSKMQRKVQEAADAKAPGVLRVGEMTYTRAVSHPDPNVGGLHPGSRLAADVEVLQQVPDEEVGSILPTRIEYTSYSGSPMTRYENVWDRIGLEKIQPGTPKPETVRAQVGDPGTAEGLPVGEERPLAEEAPAAVATEPATVAEQPIDLSTQPSAGASVVEAALTEPSANGAREAEVEEDGTMDRPDGEWTLAGFGTAGILGVLGVLGLLWFASRRREEAA